jgi:hypothetical protein
MAERFCDKPSVLKIEEGIEMSSPDVSGPDGIEGLFDVGSAASIDDGLRRSLLVRTTAVIRRRRRARRLCVAAALLGCYLAGIITAQTCLPGVTGPGRSSASVAQPPEEPGGPAPSEETTSPPHRKQTPPRASSPYRALCRLADRCLQEGDISAAVEYSYRALRHASAEERAFSTEDNWLVMSLKVYQPEQEK